MGRDSDGGLVANRGLLALPEPADGDLFSDIEGARYYSEDGREFGLQYLVRVVDTAEADEAGQPRYGPGAAAAGHAAGWPRICGRPRGCPLDDLFQGVPGPACMSCPDEGCEARS